MRSSIAAIAAAMLNLGSSAYAAISQNCLTGTSVCYSFNVPDLTASSGNGSIYFQISAPTTYSWVALGQGSGMAGANIFVMYTSFDGKNVTLSPRLGTGHTMPVHDNGAQVTLLDGSGVSNGTMTANVKCSNCNSWSGGSMDLSGTSSKWIYAYLSGSPLNSDDPNEVITVHGKMGTLNLDMTAARGGDDANPFTILDRSTSDGNATTTTNPSSTAASATGAVSCTPNSNSTHPDGPPWEHNSKRDACPEGTSPVDSNSNTTSATQDAAFNPTTFNRVATIHGVLAGIVFVALFPVGGVIIRLGNFSNLVWVHAGLQIAAYLIYIIAFVMGVYLVRTLQPSSHAHPLIGGLIFLALLSQPITGWLHHRYFMRFGGRSKSSFAHLTIGRVAILAGMLNGGLGIQLAGVPTGGAVAYGVITAIMAALYIAAIVIGERKRKRATNTTAPGFPARHEGNPRMNLQESPSETNLERVQTNFPKYDANQR